MKSRYVTWPVLCTLGAAAIVAACGGGSDSNSDSGTGTMRLSLTDAPACGYDNVFVTVEKVRVHRSSAAGANDGGWEEMAVSPALQVDLLTLTNGTLEPLGQMQLPAGTYTQMRLLLAANGNSAPWANYIVPEGGSATPLTTPSAQQSGLKMNVNLTVNPDTVADFAIDFDACKSFVRAGNSGRYLLKPVLQVIPITSSKIVGFVAPAMAASGVATSVSAQVDGVPVRATAPDAAGRFELFPIRTGTYDLVVTSTGRVNAVMTGVPVTAAGATTVSSAAVRIEPPAWAASAVASGTVTGGIPLDRQVRAVQTLSSGTKMEAGYAGPNETTGAYAMRLTTGAPASVPYAVNPPSITFASDVPRAGAYRIEASSTGYTTAFADITLASDTTVNLSLLLVP
jgi:Domain of unknown function (DUF4382)